MRMLTERRRFLLQETKRLKAIMAARASRYQNAITEATRLAGLGQ